MELIRRDRCRHLSRFRAAEMRPPLLNLTWRKPAQYSRKQVKNTVRWLSALFKALSMTLPAVDDEVGSNEDTPTLCLVCAKKPIEYEPLCGHPSLCKSCAMKQVRTDPFIFLALTDLLQATGGKCVLTMLHKRHKLDRSQMQGLFRAILRGPTNCLASTSCFANDAA